MKTKELALLHILLAVYSLGGIFTKMAGGYDYLSFQFIFCYGMVLFILVIYAVGWQQIIKRVPLTIAFANKAITVVWGIVWGALFFKESITLGKIIGAILVIIGVMIFAQSDEVRDNE